MAGRLNRSGIRIGLIAVGLLVGLTILGAYRQSGPATGATDARLVVESELLTWGDVSAAAGPVSKSVVVRNEGTDPLVIEKIATSCGCTSASLSTAGGTTPRLGMDHGTLPSVRTTIAPGESGTLTITYDPNFHYARGLLKRVVYLQSNDASRPEVAVTNLMNVTD